MIEYTDPTPASPLEGRGVPADSTPAVSTPFRSALGRLGLSKKGRGRGGGSNYFHLNVVILLSLHESSQVIF